MAGRKASLCVASLAGLIWSGCVADNGRDRLGRTYYVDGAGNWGFGVLEVTHGLRKAGYKGRVRVFPWSLTFNPVVDQTLRFIARSRGKDLARDIAAYERRNPGAEVNIIALSAGTGVATWACESLDPSTPVRNLVLLGSSLSFDYDMRQALKAIDGRIYVYYTRTDAILRGPVRALGTIDGVFDCDSLGLVGLKQRSEYKGRVVNIGWTRRFEKYGWRGSHTGCTAEPFVRLVLAKHVVGPVAKPQVAAGRSVPAVAGVGRSSQPDVIQASSLSR